MCRYFLCFNFLLIIWFSVVNPVYAEEFSITLRKTDINELKQQLIPPFEQHILTVNKLQKCLEGNESIENCLDRLFALASKDYQLEDQQKYAQIIKNIQSHILEKELTRARIISELKKLRAKAEDTRDCLEQGKTANELKDCFLTYQQHLDP